MKKIRHPSPPRNRSDSQPDLFSWQSAVITPPSLAARKLARRFGLTLSTAITVARLAGVGSEMEAR